MCVRAAEGVRVWAEIQARDEAPRRHACLVHSTRQAVRCGPLPIERGRVSGPPGGRGWGGAALGRASSSASTEATPWSSSAPLYYTLRRLSGYLFRQSRVFHGFPSPQRPFVLHDVTLPQPASQRAWPVSSAQGTDFRPARIAPDTVTGIPFPGIHLLSATLQRTESIHIHLFRAPPTGPCLQPESPRSARREGPAPACPRDRTVCAASVSAPLLGRRAHHRLTSFTKRKKCR